jgi:hypothetical protein
MTMENAKGILKDGYKFFCSLLASIDDILQVMKQPVTQQRLQLPEKLRALQKLLVSNGLKEKFADLISAIGIQQSTDEGLINEEMLKYAPNIDKLQKMVKKKLQKQMDENDDKFKNRVQTFIDTETDLRRRLKEMEQKVKEMSAIAGKDKVKIGEYALKASLFDKT